MAQHYSKTVIHHYQGLAGGFQRETEGVGAHFTLTFYMLLEPVSHLAVLLC